MSRRRAWADAAARRLLWAAYRLQLVYWFVFRPTEPSAHVALWWRGRVLVVEHTYRRHRSLPAGRLRRGESPAAGACRELREEVGIDLVPAVLRPAGVLESRQQWKRDRAHLFELELDAPVEPRADRREIAAAAFVEPAEALRRQPSDILRDYLQQLQRRAPGTGPGRS